MRCWRPGPFLYAVQMKHMVTALTTPHWGCDTNRLTAHHALVFFCGELFNQGTCLKNKTDKLKHRRTFLSQPRISKASERRRQTERFYGMSGSEQGGCSECEAGKGQGYAEMEASGSRSGTQEGIHTSEETFPRNCPGSHQHLLLTHG